MMHNLSTREQIMVVAAALCCLLTLLYYGIITPYTSAIATLDSKITSRRQQFQQVEQLCQEYLQLQKQVQALHDQQHNLPPFSLFSFVEKQISRIAKRENLTSMRPLPTVNHNDITEEAVEIKLEDISLNQVVQLLQAFDHSPAAIQVKVLKLKTRYDNQQQLDATLRISSYSKG